MRGGGAALGTRGGGGTVGHLEGRGESTQVPGLGGGPRQRNLSLGTRHAGLSPPVPPPSEPVLYLASRWPPPTHHDATPRHPAD